MNASYYPSRLVTEHTDSTVEGQRVYIRAQPSENKKYTFNAYNDDGELLASSSSSHALSEHCMKVRGAIAVVHEAHPWAYSHESGQ